MSDKIKGMWPGYDWARNKGEKSTYITIRKWVECQKCHQPVCVHNEDSIVKCPGCDASIGVKEI